MLTVFGYICILDLQYRFFIFRCVQVVKHCHLQQPQMISVFCIKQYSSCNNFKLPKTVFTDFEDEASFTNMLCVNHTQTSSWPNYPGCLLHNESSTKPIFFVFKVFNNTTPAYLSDLIISYRPIRKAPRTLNKNLIQEPISKNQWGQGSFSCAAATVGNKLTSSVRQPWATTLGTFKRNLKCIFSIHN